MNNTTAGERTVARTLVSLGVLAGLWLGYHTAATGIADAAHDARERTATITAWATRCAAHEWRAGDASQVNGARRALRDLETIDALRATPALNAAADRVAVHLAYIETQARDGDDRTVVTADDLARLTHALDGLGRAATPGWTIASRINRRMQTAFVAGVVGALGGLLGWLLALLAQIALPARTPPTGDPG